MPGDLTFLGKGNCFIVVAGHVYGERALEAQARQNEGSVICPRTKEIYKYEDAEKVYIM